MSPIYGEIRYADGSQLEGLPTRERLDTFGRTVQEAVDELAAEIGDQGGLGVVDLGKTSGRLALYAVNPDGTLHESGAASAPLRHPRRH